VNVKIVWGGWSCAAGYVYWAYVCEIKKVPDWARGKIVDEFRGEDIESIGKKVYEPPSSGPNDDNKFPKGLCQQWCKEHNHKIIGYIKLETN